MRDDYYTNFRDIKKFINIPCNFSIKYCYRGFQEIQITEIKRIYNYCSLMIEEYIDIFRRFFSITQGDSIIHVDISENMK